MLLQKVRFPSFYGHVVFHCVKAPHLFTRSSLDEHLGCLQILAIGHNTAMNLVVHIFFQVGVLGFLGYIPRSGTSGSEGSSTFNFLRELHIHQLYI